MMERFRHTEFDLLEDQYQQLRDQGNGYDAKELKEADELAFFEGIPHEAYCDVITWTYKNYFTLDAEQLYTAINVTHWAAATFQELASNRDQDPYTPRMFLDAMNTLRLDRLERFEDLLTAVPYMDMRKQSFQRFTELRNFMVTELLGAQYLDEQGALSVITDDDEKDNELLKHLDGMLGAEVAYLFDTKQKLGPSRKERIENTGKKISEQVQQRRTGLRTMWMCVVQDRKSGEQFVDIEVVATDDEIARNGINQDKTRREQ